MFEIIYFAGACDIIVDGKSVQRLEDPASFGDLALMYNCPRNATVSSRA